jgi:hypothetical protein
MKIEFIRRVPTMKMEFSKSAEFSNGFLISHERDFWQFSFRVPTCYSILLCHPYCVFLCQQCVYLHQYSVHLCQYCVFLVSAVLNFVSTVLNFFSTVFFFVSTLFTSANTVFFFVSTVLTSSVMCFPSSVLVHLGQYCVFSPSVLC